MLLSRDPDALLLYAPLGLPGGRLDAWVDAPFRGAIEARLAHDDLIAERFAPAALQAPARLESGGKLRASLRRR